MSGLAKVLEKWKLNPDKKSDAELVEQWKIKQSGDMGHFVVNLWEDSELPNDAVKGLANTLLEIAKIFFADKEEEPEQKMRKLFETWSNETLLQGSTCDKYRNEYFYHITSDYRLRKSAENHDDPNKFPDEIFQDSTALKDKIKELNKYSNPKEKRAIWANWINEEKPCRAITNVYNKINKDVLIDQNDMLTYREGLLNALRLKEEGYRDYIVILRYTIPDNLDIHVPTVADARWKNAVFKPKASDAECGATYSEAACHEGVHGHIDFKNIDGVVVLRPIQNS